MRCLVGFVLLAATSSFRLLAPPRQRRIKLAAPLDAVPACPVDELPNPEISYLDKSELVPKAEVPKSPDATVFPLFPLGSVVYLPGSEHILNIFEPRYRKMYNDILLSGSRSFAVAMVGEDGRVCETASLFYLEELKEVSEQTKDRVKYICKHTVTKRVKLKRVLNPKAWTDATTYLRVEVEEIDPLPDAAAAGALDAAEAAAGALLSEVQEKAAARAGAGEAGGEAAEEASQAGTAGAADAAAAGAAAAAADEYLADIEELCADMDAVVELQNSFKEEPRFSPSLQGVFRPATLAASEAKLWALAALWQTFASERVSDVQRRGSAQVEDRLMTYLTKNGTVDVKKLAGKELTVPDQLQQEIRSMTAKVRAEMDEKMPTTTVPYQQLLQTPGRGDRLRILRRIVVEEKRRLAAKASLRSLFASPS